MYATVLDCKTLYIRRTLRRCTKMIIKADGIVRLLMIDIF